MPRTVEMFDKPPRAKPRMMMKVDDFGPERTGHFVCSLCQFEDWYVECSLSDYRRGIPCPKCNTPTSNSAQSEKP